MPIQKVNIAPGFFREGTAYTVEGRWYDGDKVRFRAGLPEKIGGWTRLSPQTFLGSARSLISWVALSGKPYLGIGTEFKYYLEDGGFLVDITPIRKVSDPMPTNPFKVVYGVLIGDIDEATTEIPVVNPEDFPPTGGIIKIGVEEIRYEAVVAGKLSGAARGYNKTVPNTHLLGDGVGCSTLVVTDINHESGVNDFVTYSNVLTDVNVFTTDMLNKEQQVYAYIDTQSYAINIEGVFSTAMVEGGGTEVRAEYQVNTGLDVFIAGNGWGSDPWSTNGWGSPGELLGAKRQLRLWTADHYGEDLVYGPRNGPLFYWKEADGSLVRGKSLKTVATDVGFQGEYVPNYAAKIMVPTVQRFVIAFGTNGYLPGEPDTPNDPMMVRWSDQENPFQWIPSATNQSGEFRLAKGSYIVTAENTRQEILIWSDSTVYSMQYLGPPYVWGFNVLMENISIISPNAVVVANNMVYWMGKDKFYTYSGRVETLPCAVRQYIFDDLNRDQGYQVFGGSNEAFNEVWWFYPARGETTVGKYVIYNYLENVWSYGTMARTAWLDSPIRDYPIATDYTNHVLYHEVGVDDLSSDSPQGIRAYIQTADFDIGDGHHFALVTRMLPDINFNGSTINKPSLKMAVKARRNAGARYVEEDEVWVDSADDYGTTRVYTVQEFDGQVYVRVRGRQMAVRFESTDKGVDWQIGTIRVDIRPDGRQ